MIDAETLLDQAFDYLEGRNRDVPKSILLFEQLAENGSVAAQFALGEIYWNGCDQIARNDELAIYWYSMAGENGHPLVQLWLGNNYAIGIRTAPDAKKAVYWYSKAASNNVVLAQYHLGICLHTGWGVARDEERAFMWIKRAADNSFIDAELFVSDAYRNGIGVPANPDKYHELSEDILRRYLPLAFTIPTIALPLAKALLHGTGVERNPALAVQILSSEYIKNHTDATLLLSDCYEKGLGTKQDIGIARAILKELSHESNIARNKLKLLELRYGLKD